MLEPLEPVILHADLDCFYCQVERIRLGLPDDQPMAVQQWSNVIAVNYPARAQGVSRHSSVAECLQSCPSMVFVHVPTYSITKPGSLSRYEAKGSTPMEPVPLCPSVSEHKASLSPYRKASLLIFSVFGRFADVLEKAGLDEAFMDVTRAVNRMIEDKYEMNMSDWENWLGLEEAWRGLVWDDLGVPALPDTSEDSGNTRMINELRIHMAAQLAKKIRFALRDELGYTCSIGIAHNKMLAKLGSARNKPFNQTFILEKMTSELMRTVPLRKIRFLGGKLGALLSAGGGSGESDEEGASGDEDSDDEQVSPTGAAEVMAADLWTLSVTELSMRLGGDLESAKWAYQIVRGNDNSTVAPRSIPKSFMAAKSMRPALKEWSQVERWLRLLSLELWERLEEDSQMNCRWPRTITLCFKTYTMKDGKSQATEFPILSPDVFSVDLLVTHLTRQLLQVQHSIFPMQRLTIAVSRFTPLEAPGGKKWSTLDQFCTGTKRQPDFDSIRVEHDSPIVSVPKKNSAKKGPLFDFLKPKKQTLDTTARENLEERNRAEDEWGCGECSRTISMWDIDAIQEHQDFHLACRLSAQ